MRRGVAALALLLVLLAVATAGCSTAGGGGAVAGVQWSYDWTEASSRAQAENKVIMINFYTDMCPACRMLDRNTFADSELGNFLNESFIPLKSNAGKTNLHARYGIPAVPTTVFATPEGNEIARMVGYRPPDQFHQGATEVLNAWQSGLLESG